MKNRRIDQIMPDELTIIGDMLYYVPSAAKSKARRFLYGCEGRLKNWSYDETINYGDMHRVMKVFQYLNEIGVVLVSHEPYLGPKAILKFFDYYKKAQMAIAKRVIQSDFGLEILEYDKDSITVALSTYNIEDFKKNLKSLMSNGVGGITEILIT